MSLDPIGDKESRMMLRYIFLIFGLAALILAVVLAFLYSQYIISPQKDFFVTFGGDLTFTDESGSTWLIDNRESNHEKLLIVYWSGNETKGNVPSQTIKSSELVDQNQKSLDSSNINFNGFSVLIANLTHGRNEITISLADGSLSLGSFSGNIILDGSISDSIPITISTKPLVKYDIMLVVIGALISVCMWEIIRFYKNKILSKNNTQVASLSGNALNVLAVERTRNLIRNASPSVTIPKIVLIELFSILLGIAVALFGVLYNESVIGVLILGAYEVMVLIGIGLAAGSLKELVDKIERP